MSYLVAALLLIVAAQSAGLYALARARRNARREADEYAQGRAEAGAVAHDLNNFLSIMLNYSTFVLEDLADDDPSRDDVVEIRRAALAAGILTQSLGARQRPRDVPAHAWAPQNRRAAA